MTFSFTAQKRGKEKAEDLRAENIIPAILYGAGEESVNLSVTYAGFAKLFKEAGESSLVDLSIDEAAPIKVLIQAVQYEPIKGKLTHVDFHRINMNKEMHATVQLSFVGEAPAVKELGGTLMKTHNSLEISCLPKDLVNEIKVDLSVLKTFEDIIHVKDLTLPTGIKVTNGLDLVLAKVAAPLTEAQLKAMEETGPASVDQVEVEKKGKEEVEGEEGEAKAEAPKKDEKKKEEKK